MALGLDPYEWCKRDWRKCIDHFAARSLGCLFDSKEFYYDLWDNYLPPDAHQRCSGRLHISITLLPSLSNKVVSHWSTREDFIWTIVASCCLPVAFMRSVPSTRYGLSFDGGFSNDQPCYDQYTVTVSAINRSADLFPPPECALSSWELVVVPSFERVWQVAQMACETAAKCPDFERDEWQSIRKVAVTTTTATTTTTTTAAATATATTAFAASPPPVPDAQQASGSGNRSLRASSLSLSLSRPSPSPSPSPSVPL